MKCDNGSMIMQEKFYNFQRYMQKSSRLNEYGLRFALKYFSKEKGKTWKIKDCSKNLDSY